MARMNIEARAVRLHPAGGSSADRGAAAVVVLSITDETGKAVEDLQAGDVSVRAIGGPGGGGPEVTVAAMSGRGEGVYVVEIVPLPAGAAWPPGEHVLAVKVRRVFDRGQGLAVLANS